MAAQSRFRGQDGVLRAPWFAVSVVAFWAVCLGLAAIGGWAGIAAVVVALLIVIAVIISSAGPRDGGEDGAGGVVVVPGKPHDSGAGGP